MQQLAFPDKGGMVWGLGIVILFFSILAILALSQISVTFEEQDGYNLAITIISWGLSISILMIPVGLSIRFSGRVEAKKVWDSLYYCFRDNVVYVPYDSTRCAPPGMLRRKILNY